MSESLVETIIERRDHPVPVFEPMKRMFVERGTVADWNLLHHLHYKAETLFMGSRFYRCSLDGETIAVLLLSPPRGMVRERHLIFPGMKPGRDTRITNTYRFEYWNRHIRVISRFVTDTQFRGIGVGYRMMNLVARMSERKYVEIQSSMSRYNFFGQKAGFRFVQPLPAANRDAGLKIFRMHFDTAPQDAQGLIQEFETFPERRQIRVRKALIDFYSGKSSFENTGKRRENAAERIAEMSTRALIRAIQQMCLASPMYGIFENPDYPDPVPERIPLLAFDLQKPTEPLQWNPKDSRPIGEILAEKEESCLTST